jgi:hypothetical protein
MGPEVLEPFLLCDESSGLESGDDEEASSSSRERAAPSLRVLDFFWLASSHVAMTAAWNQAASHRHWNRRRTAWRVFCV